MPEQKKDPAEGWTHEGGGVWVPPMPSERATPEQKAHKARCSVATGSASSCCYCGGTHHADNCPTTYTPINDCEHKDAADGCCLHPKNMTPECHVGACPRLHRRIYDAWHASLPNT